MRDIGSIYMKYILIVMIEKVISSINANYVMYGKNILECMKYLKMNIFVGSRKIVHPHFYRKYRM